MEDIPGNCEWNPSAAIGYRDGGSAPVWMDGGTLFKVGSKNGEEICGLADMAVCEGLALFWVTGDWTVSPFTVSCACAAACAACASCNRRR